MPIKLITLPPVVVRNIVINMSVCLSVCLFVCLSTGTSKAACPNFTKFTACVTGGRGPSRGNHPLVSTFLRPVHHRSFKGRGLTRSPYNYNTAWDMNVAGNKAAMLRVASAINQLNMFSHFPTVAACNKQPMGTRRWHIPRCHLGFFL